MCCPLVSNFDHISTFFLALGGARPKFLRSHAYVLVLPVDGRKLEEYSAAWDKRDIEGVMKFMTEQLL